MEALIQRPALRRRRDLGRPVAARARRRVPARARVLRRAERVSKVDRRARATTTWRGGVARSALGARALMYAKYRRYIDDDLEPVLRVPRRDVRGAQHLARRAWPDAHLEPARHLVVGTCSERRSSARGRVFAAAPPEDAARDRDAPQPGEGRAVAAPRARAHARAMLGAFADMRVDLVLCGHDHQEAVHYVEHTKQGTVVSTAGTVSTGRAAAVRRRVNSITHHAGRRDRGVARSSGTAERRLRRRAASNASRADAPVRGDRDIAQLELELTAPSRRRTPTSCSHCLRRLGLTRHATVPTHARTAP